MKKLVLAALVGGLAVIALSPMAESARRGPTVKTIDRLGAEVTVPANQVEIAKAGCPRGYAPVAGQELLGATELVYSIRTTSRRGWEVAVGNPTTAPQDFSAGVMCQKGGSGVRVRSASTSQRRRMIAAAEEKLRAER
jgi:hypothetical protein